jgi:hypothetical protein
MQQVRLSTLLRLCFVLCGCRYWSNDERWSAVSAEQRGQLFKERFGAHAAAAAARKEVRTFAAGIVGQCANVRVWNALVFATERALIGARLAGQGSKPGHLAVSHWHNHPLKLVSKGDKFESSLMEICS